MAMLVGREEREEEARRGAGSGGVDDEVKHFGGGEGGRA